MRLPETENPHYQHAFKHGYRMALERKSLEQMPASLREDPKVRQYFERGWQQANDALAAQQEQLGKPNWKNRAIWFVFVVISGVLTAKLMITNIEAEQAELQARINAQQETSEIPPLELNADQLRLLNTQSYKDLQANQQAFSQIELPPLEPITNSPLIIEQALLLSQTHGASYDWGSSIPKYERRLKADFQISAPNESTLTIRWRFGLQIVNEEALALSKGLNSLHSSQTMSSSRQGTWYLELLAQQNVIYRQEFSYGSLPSNP